MIYCLLVLTIGRYIPIEFSKSGLRDVYYDIIYFCLPLSIICFIYFKVRNPSYRSALIVLIGIISAIILGLAFFAKFMCGFTNEIVFVDRNNPTHLIVQRSYGCGAYDSALPNYETYEVRPLNFILNFVKMVDTTKIDRTIWIKVNNRYDNLPKRYQS